MGIVKKAIKPMFKRDKWNILRGDTVKILAGKDKDQVGTVVKVIRDDRKPRVVVSGINLQKRHIKRTEQNPGGIISVEGPIHYSNVSLIDPVTKAAVRVTRRYLEDGSKVRMTRGKLASGSIIPRPEILKQRRKPRDLEGPRDTARSVADDVTFTPGDWPKFALERMYSTVATPVGMSRSLITSGSNRRRLSGSTNLLFSARGFAALSHC